MADQDKKQDVPDHLTKLKQKIKGVSKLTTHHNPKKVLLTINTNILQ